MVEVELLAVLETATGKSGGGMRLAIALHVACMLGHPAREAEPLVEHFETRNVTKHPPSIGNMPLLARYSRRGGRGAARRGVRLPGVSELRLHVRRHASRRRARSPCAADGDYERGADLASSVVEPLAEALAFPERGRAPLSGKAKIALGDPPGDAVAAAATSSRSGMRPALAEARLCSRARSRPRPRLPRWRHASDHPARRARRSRQEHDRLRDGETRSSSSTPAWRSHATSTSASTCSCRTSATSKDVVCAVILTHGHDDHVGGLPTSCVKSMSTR